MVFIPITNKHRFPDDVLVKGFPDYMRQSIQEWIIKTLNVRSLLNSSLKQKNFTFYLSTRFRKKFPEMSSPFIQFIFSDCDLTTDFIALLLQEYCNATEAKNLEEILKIFNSEWAVLIKPSDNEENIIGRHNLTKRIPEIIQKVSETALTNERLLNDAWIACYAKKPDYDKAVIDCVDVLEGLLRDNYFPNAKKPELSNFIKQLEESPDRIKHKGDNLIINPETKSKSTSLLGISKTFIPIRNIHKKGTGRPPTKEEAEFVLHYTIFIWNMHNQK